MTKIIDLTCSDEEEKPNLNCLKDYVKSKVRIKNCRYSKLLRVLSFNF